ncbi:MAG TPA: hypothetical protein VJ975_05495 [Candidatus Limnocylindria bacterium]|nr:hypothetical protein [Candidatus Limnocylindria bacterium]
MTTRGRHLRGPIAFWALAGIALLVSHDTIFIVQYGPGEALTRTLRGAGHAYWTIASLALAAIGLAVGASFALRLLRLRHQARGLAAARTRPEGWGRRLIVTWGRLFAVVAIGFVIQESAEHFAMHGHAIGLGALIGPEYPLALPILALVSLAAAVVAVYLIAVEVALEATIAAAVSHPRAPLRIMRPPLDLGVTRIPVLARAAAGRAPPSVLTRRV